MNTTQFRCTVREIKLRHRLKYVAKPRYALSGYDKTGWQKLIYFPSLQVEKNLLIITLNRNCKETLTKFSITYDKTLSHQHLSCFFYHWDVIQPLLQTEEFRREHIERRESARTLQTFYSMRPLWLLVDCGHHQIALHHDTQVAPGNPKVSRLRSDRVI